MTSYAADLPYSAKPRKLDAFLSALGDAPGVLSRSLLDQVRVMAATSNEGVVLLIGPSALWLVPWAMDALQPGTRVVALVEPGQEALVQQLGPLVQDDLRLALRVQDAASFLADMDDQKFDLIVDTDSSVPVDTAMKQIFTFGSLILGRSTAASVDPKDAVSLELADEQGAFSGQLIKPRPATLRRRGGRKNRIADREPGQKPPKELLEGFFPEGGSATPR